jgi:predicted dithiol-disulfide oxidoreductase (DUF899 family)
MTPSLFDNLRSRETTFVLTSRAPYPKIAQAQAERDWDVPWYSSFGGSFNDDYGATVNPAAPQYNYRAEPELAQATEMPGFSCFLRDGNSVYHTYSTYARGTEYIGNAYTLLDLTALGRRESWEEPKDRTQVIRWAIPHSRTDACNASSYPASSMAARNASPPGKGVAVTVTFPPSTSTSTPVTPASAPTSSRTARAQ